MCEHTWGEITMHGQTWKYCEKCFKTVAHVAKDPTQ